MGVVSSSKRRNQQIGLVSMPFLHGEAKTASAGSVSRVPAADIEDVVVKFLKEHLAAQQDKPTTSALPLGDRGALAQLIAGIVVHRDKLIIRLKSHADEASDCPDDRPLTIPWQKPPSKRSRDILLPHNASRSKVRPELLRRHCPSDLRTSGRGSCSDRR